VYIHALVRDAERQKMSKTKGNVLDPIEVIQKYGTDATRFTLAAMASPGTDIAFNESRTEGYRAFANKIWNAARFIFMNMGKPSATGFSLKDAPLEDRWILSRLSRVAQQMNEALAEYRFHEAAHVIYNFFWGEFCDWYIELVKPRLADETSAALAVVTRVFEKALLLLSPIMPFITEELWHALHEGKAPHKSIALAQFPQGEPEFVSDQAELEMAILQDLIVSVRNIRAELKVEPKVKVPIQVHADDTIRALVEQNRGAVERLANVAQIDFVPQSLAQEAGARSTARFDVRVIYEQKIDVAAERERLQKELAKLEKEQANAERQLSNQGFLAKAPAQVVEGLRKRLEEVKVLLAKNAAALQALQQ
jgi:valyl-tRNA synthetase